MTWQDGIALLAIPAGSLFFLGGTIGLIRFPDAYSRLHALTKADNTGLSLIILGLSLRAESVWVVGKLLLIWALVMLASTTSCHLVASVALRSGIEGESPAQQEPAQQ